MSDFDGVRVLVVGDNAYERRIVVDLLRGVNVAQVRLADDAVEAYSAMSLDPADVLVVDAEMKPHSGLQLARELRASDMRGRNTPIVLYTAELSRGFVETAETAGVAEVLPKPVSIGDLKRCLTGALFGAAGGQSLADRVATSAASRGPGRTLKRADWELPGQRLERTVREALELALHEARVALSAWTARPSSDTLDALRVAIDRATIEAQGADAPTRKALVAIRAVASAPKPHSQLIETGLVGVRALLAEPDRRALREALADAVAEAAFAKTRR